MAKTGSLESDLLPEGSQVSMDAWLWVDELIDGSFIEVTCHARSVVDGFVVYSLLIEGQPRVNVPILRISRELMSKDFW